MRLSHILYLNFVGELPNARAILASKVAEAPLESQMGWVHGSRQTRTYIHLSMRDHDNAILKAYGIKQMRIKSLSRCQRSAQGAMQ